MPAARRILVAERIDAGQPLADIERELIDDAPWLDDEERDALWMFAWSYQAQGRPPREHVPAVAAF